MVCSVDPCRCRPASDTGVIMPRNGAINQNVKLTRIGVRLRIDLIHPRDVQESTPSSAKDSKHTILETDDPVSVFKHRASLPTTVLPLRMAVDSAETAAGVGGLWTGRMRRPSSHRGSRLNDVSADASNPGIGRSPRFGSVDFLSE